MKNKTNKTYLALLSLTSFLTIVSLSVGAGKSALNTTVNKAAGASLACGVRYLLGQFVTTNTWTFAVDPWLFPVTDRVVTGYVTNRYRVEMKEVDVYKWDYRTIYFEEYEVIKKVKGESVDDKLKLVRVKKRRKIASPADARSPRYVIKSSEKILGTQRKTGKTRTTRVSIPDPSGPLTRRRPIHKRQITDGDGWSTGFLGQNAMVLLALRKSGVSDDNAKLKKLADSLAQAVDGYSPPDGTWDLAWLVAAFSNMHNDNDYKRVREMLINKLLDSQIKKGPARGMWGALCINGEMLGTALVRHHAVVNIFNKKKQRLNPKKQERKIEKLEEDMEGAIEDIGFICKRIAQQGLRFHYVKKLYDLPPFGDRAVRIEGLPYYFYSQDLADIESTSIALYAIREAAENGYLPAKTLRPRRVGGGSRMSWPRPETSSAILARAANAIVALQNKNGTWDEVNIHQPNDYFAKVGMPPLGKDELWVVPASVSLLATAQAYSGLLNAGRSVGLSKLLGRYRAKVIDGDKAWKGVAMTYLRNESALKRPQFFAHCMPYDFFFYLSSIHRRFGGATEQDRDVWEKLAFDLMSDQAAAGAWGGSPMAFKSTSVWRGMEFFAKKEHDEKQKKLSENKRAPFNLAAFWSEWRSKGRTPRNLPFTTTIASTCYSMLFLADGAFPPIGLLTSAQVEAKPSVAMTNAMKLLLKRDGMSLTHLLIGSKHSNLPGGLPLIFADGRLLLADSALATAMKAYLKTSGVLMVDVGARTNLQALEAKLKSFVPGGKIAGLPADAKFLEDFKGPLPTMKCLIKSDGTVCGLLVTSASAHSDVVYRLARQAIHAKYGIRYFLSGGRNSYSHLSSLLSQVERKAASSVKLPSGDPAGRAGSTSSGGGFAAPPRALAEDEVW